MSFGEAALKLLKEQMLPEVVEIKQFMSNSARIQEALVLRLERMEKESALRFELIDKRFEQVDKRFEQVERRFEQVDKRFEQIDKQLELIDKRIERLETAVTGVREDMTGLKESMARLGLLADYVRRVDEMASELRELRRRQDAFERRLLDEVLPRLPKVGT